MTDTANERIPRVIVANYQLPRMLELLAEIRDALDAISDRPNEETSR